MLDLLQSTANPLDLPAVSLGNASPATAEPEALTNSDMEDSSSLASLSDSDSDPSTDTELTPAQMKLRKARKRAARGRRGGRAAEPDIEDLGFPGLASSLAASVKPVTPVEHSTAKLALTETKAAPRAEPKEMISSLTRKALTKQGYGLIGTHSGVKTCRWTKAALRGRGMCYKQSAS